MKTILPAFFFLLTGYLSTAQTIWKDTLKTNVDLRSFQLSQKVVQVGYGKVIMYFNQSDYLENKAAADTVKVSPKYFADELISELLKKGQVKIIKRSDNSTESKIVHYLKQYGSMCERTFELQDGSVFFSYIEVTGIMGAFTLRGPDHWAPATQKKAPVKEFAYPEEYSGGNDLAKVKIKDYFPLKKSVHYVYSNGNGYGELDTNVCKPARLANQDVYYFAECYSKYQVVSIGSTMFGPGIYFYKNDSLFALESNYENEIGEKDISDAALLLPANMAIGDTCSIDLGINKQTFTFLAKENLQLGNTILKDCIKFKIKEYWPDTIYIGYVWLQKDVGLVKWMRFTGRVDELVNQY